MQRAFQTTISTILFASLFVLSSDGKVQAAGIDDAVTQLSEKIAKYLKVRDEDSIILGKFNGPDTGSLEIPLEKLLKETLTKKGIKVVSDSNFGVRGNFKIGGSGNRITVLLIVRMIDQRKNEVASFPKRFSMTPSPTTGQTQVANLSGN